METRSPALGTVADSDAAARIRQLVDRVLWQRFELHPDHAEGVVVGVRHHRPVELRVGAGAALALAADGVPTVTRRVGS